MTQTATSPAPPGPASLSRQRILIIIGALLLGMLLAALDQTIVATALPTIAGDLHGLFAGATFFRLIGGSFGTAVFGAIFANVLPHNLARELHGLTLPHGLTAASGASPAVLDRLPAPVHAAFVLAYATSLHTVFLAAVPVGALAPTARPSVRTTDQEMERAITSLLSRERRRVVYGDLVSAAGLKLPPRAGWLLYRVGEHEDLSRHDLAGLLQLPDTDLQHRLADLTTTGYVTDGDANQPVRLTGTGQTAYQDLMRAREDRLRKLCADWHPDGHPQLAALLTTITHKLAASGEKPGADLDAA